jgi:hypothetical protein
VRSNQFIAAALDDLFGTLPGGGSSKIVLIGSNPGTSGCDTSIATAKGWTVY